MWLSDCLVAGDVGTVSLFLLERVTMLGAWMAFRKGVISESRSLPYLLALDTDINAW
jgi:hypothetical protein